MNPLRAQIALALDAIIEEKNGTAFQRLAYQCLRTRWPSLASVAEQADLGEDAITILDEASDGVIRSLACSLTAKWEKVAGDAQKIILNRSDVQELIFATPKTVTRKIQVDWEKRIKDKYALKLIVVERAEFLAVLERPESQSVCRTHLNLLHGYLHLLKGAEDLRDGGETKLALKKVSDAERGALDSGDWHTYCRAQMLTAQLHLENEGLCESYRNKALEALSTAKEHKLTDLIAECLGLRANSILAREPDEARKLLDEAEKVVGANTKIKGWICLVRAELENFLGNLTSAGETLDRWELLNRGDRKVDYQNFFHLKFRLAAKRGEFKEALDNLNRALKRARAKKRWVSTALMLKEKARCLAHNGEFRRAASEAEKSRIKFEEAHLERESFDSALLSGHLFFECRGTTRALALADYVLSKADLKLYRNEYMDALQLKVRSLQILKRVKKAKEFNSRFRELTAYQPQSQVVADIQDALLYCEFPASQHERGTERGYDRLKHFLGKEKSR